MRGAHLVTIILARGCQGQEREKHTLGRPSDNIYSLSMLCKGGQVLDLSVLALAFDLPKLRGVS